MITLAKVSYLHEADLLCMKLEEAGIGYFIADQNLSSLNPLYSGAIGGIRIQINEDDLERAQVALHGDIPVDSGMFRCPRCGSDAVDYENVSKRSAFLSMLLFFFPFTWKKEKCTCRDCGHMWKDKTDPHTGPTQ